MKYTAITIGPILKTVHQAKSAKAIWAASYMFSYLVKQLIIEIGLTNEDVLLPYFEPNDLTDKHRVGIFPDRVMIKKEIPYIENIINKVIEDFAGRVTHEKELTSVTNIVPYLKDYIHFQYVEVVPTKDNIILELNNYLDTLELRNRIVLNADDDVLKKFFEDTYYNFLIEDEFDNTTKRFPSTIEISMAEFQQKDTGKFISSVNELFKRAKGEDAADNQQKFIDRIYDENSFVPFKRNYQKYIAVVQADGDNIGSFIKELYNQDDKDKKEKLVTEFSKSLFAFAKESVDIIRKYNGTPIYAGGDDLLFLCPVAHSGYAESNDNDKNKKRTVKVEKSVLTLINQIDEVFESKFLRNSLFTEILKKVKKQPSMSYGVSISYYKFPLNQALEQGVNQLFNKAKKTYKKNAVSFAILKHSGQFIGSLFHKDNHSYKLFTEMLATKVKNENYVKSVTYKLEPQEAVFYGISLETDLAKRNTMFDNFFFNNFNESEHIKWVNGEKKLIDILEKTRELLKSVYTENPVYAMTDNKDQLRRNKENLNKVYAALRFVDFLNNEEER